VVARARDDKPLGADDLNKDIKLPIEKDPKKNEKDAANGITWSESDDKVVGAVDPGSAAAKEGVKPGWKLIDDRKTQRKLVARQQGIEAKLAELKETVNSKARAAAVHKALTNLEIEGVPIYQVRRRGRQRDDDDGKIIYI